MTTTTTQYLDSLAGKAILFVGGGNMAGALIDGLLGAKHAQGLDIDIRVSDPNADSLQALAAKGVGTCTPDNAGALIQDSDIIVLAVKPQVMQAVLDQIKPALGDQLIISIAAGLSLAKLQAMSDKTRIIRTMPNLPATVGFGATGLYADPKHISDEDRQLASAVMGASGVTVWVAHEDDLHSVTAVAGSAPAYFFYVLEAMIDKATQMGLTAEDAKQLAVTTMQGAAIMAQHADPRELRAKVTSKGGTTHAAINHMQEDRLDQLIGDAMQACYDRSVELGN